MSLSFGMKTAGDSLEDFREKVGRFKSDDLNENLAMDCAVAGWAVVDWVFKSEGEHFGFNKLDQFKKSVRRECPEMDYVREIANARKHGADPAYPTRVQNSKKHGGGFGDGFSRGFDISRLVFETEDGEFDFQDTLNAALNYLDELFRKHGIS